MKFIFPQNYKFNRKILGIIDYSTAIIDVILAVIVLGIVNLFNLNIKIKIFIFIVLFFPTILFSIVGFNGESIVNVFLYLIKYIMKPKLLLYKK